MTTVKRIASTWQRRVTREPDAPHPEAYSPWDLSNAPARLALVRRVSVRANTGLRRTAGAAKKRGVVDLRSKPWELGDAVDEATVKTWQPIRSACAADLFFSITLVVWNRLSDSLNTGIRWHLLWSGLAGNHRSCGPNRSQRWVPAPSAVMPAWRGLSSYLIAVYRTGGFIVRGGIAKLFCSPGSDAAGCHRAARRRILHLYSI